MTIFIFINERALKIRKIPINHFLISCLVPELKSFEAILHMTNCDVITGYENRLSGEMSYSSAIATQNRLKFCEQTVLIDMQLARQEF